MPVPAVLHEQVPGYPAPLRQHEHVAVSARDVLLPDALVPLDHAMGAPRHARIALLEGGAQSGLAEAYGGGATGRGQCLRAEPVAVEAARQPPAQAVVEIRAERIERTDHVPPRPTQPQRLP